MRDYLAILDLRSEAARAAVERLQGASRREIGRSRQLARLLAERDASAHAAIKSERRAREAATHALYVGLHHATEALSAVLGLQESLKPWLDSRDAETLQRAVHGPLRSMEALFDEFGRQQEALISELIGRRQELELLVRRARQDLEAATDSGA